MTINNTILYNHFSSEKILGIAENVLSRMDMENVKEDYYEELSSCMDDALIYTEDQWAIIEYYCTPITADFNEAWDEFYNDLSRCIDDGVFTETHDSID